MILTPLIASTFRPDGGAMFGIVPKPVWSSLLPADQDNTVPQNAHSILLQLDDGRLGLIDVGYGNPLGYPHKTTRLMRIGPDASIRGALQALSVDPSQIEFVILTHLHLDHAGGTAVCDPNHGDQLAFPNAIHFIHQVEWQTATSQDPLFGDAYPPRAFTALQHHATEQLLLVTDAAPDILPGVRMARTGGHTEGHCAVVLSADRPAIVHPDAAGLPPFDTVVFAGDICPTSAHLRMLYHTAFDLDPLQTRRWKQTWLPEIAEQGYLLMYCHDPEWFGSTLRFDERGRLIPGHRLRVDRPQNRNSTDDDACPPG